MKLLKSHHTLLIVTVGILFVFGVASLWLFTPYVRAAFDVYWLLFAGSLLLITTPWGKIRLSAPSDSKPRYSFWAWWLRILMLEFSLLAIFYGICHISGQVLPIFTTTHSALFTNTLYYLFVHLALLPFSAFALIACAFGYASYRCNKDAYLSTALNPILKSTATDAIGLIANTAARGGTICALSSSIMFMSLLIINTLMPHQILRAFTGFNIIPLVTLFILLALIFSKKFKQQIYFLLTKQQIPLMAVLLGFILVLSVAVMTLMLFFGDHGGVVLNTPTPIKSLLKHGWRILWDLFVTLWWLSWAPLTGIFIAKISRGYKIRDVLLATLTGPFFIAVALFFMHTYHFTLGYQPIFNIIGFIIPLVGFFFVLTIIARKATFSIVMQTYLPKRDQLKYRSQDRFVSKLLQSSAFMLYLYLPAGITLLCVLFFVFILILCLLLLLLPVALIIGLWHK